MGTKPSIFQVDHSGKRATVPVHPGMTVSHDSHGGADRDGRTGNIAQASRGKHVNPTAVHGGMVKVTKGGALARGGNHASAIDSLSGACVVPGTPKTAPGWGNSGVQSGHPLAKPPGEKRLAPVAVAFGMKARGSLTELGAAILAEAKRSK